MKKKLIKKKIEINRVKPDVQECKIVILHVINQAIKDYEHFKEKTKPEDLEVFETARDFLFDDTYMFDWGDEITNLRKLCDIIDIDVDWLRNQIVKKLDIKFRTDGIIVPERMY